jgi:hypothetical protein
MYHRGMGDPAYSRSVLTHISSTHMDLGLFHAPRIASVLAIAAFSLLVAGLDFVRRRAPHGRLGRPRGATGASRSSAPTLSEPAAPSVVVAPAIPVLQSLAAEVAAGIATLPQTGRVHHIASLPFAQFVPLPRPSPRLPANPRALSTSVLWWQGT